MGIRLKELASMIVLTADSLRDLDWGKRFSAVVKSHQDSYVHKVLIEPDEVDPKMCSRVGNIKRITCLCYRNIIEFNLYRIER